MLEIEIKSFDQLNIHTLYGMLQLRSQVFVVEQDCVYQDMDGKDQIAFHVLAHRKGRLVAYTRIFKSGDYFNEASIGRVVVDETFRRTGAGNEIMKASIQFIEENFGYQHIRISAQTYLKTFYNNLGFKETGEEYLEDGIPHINMLYRNSIQT